MKVNSYKIHIMKILIKRKQKENICVMGATELHKLSNQ